MLNIKLKAANLKKLAHVKLNPFLFLTILVCVLRVVADFIPANEPASS